MQLSISPSPFGSDNASHCGCMYDVCCKCLGFFLSFYYFLASVLYTCFSMYVSCAAIVQFVEVIRVPSLFLG